MIAVKPNAVINNMFEHLGDKVRHMHGKCSQGEDDAVIISSNSTNMML